MQHAAASAADEAEPSVRRPSAMMTLREALSAQEYEAVQACSGPLDMTASDLLGADQGKGRRRVTISFAHASAEVAAAVAGATLHKNGAVPSEFFGASGVTLRDTNKKLPACCFRMIANKPRSTVLLTLLITVAATVGLLLFGDFGISVQTELFQDRYHPDVQRDKTLRQLAYTDARSKLLYSTHRDTSEPPSGWYDESTSGSRRARALALDASTTERLNCNAARATHARSEWITVFHLVYAARDGQPVMQPHLVQQIQLVERAIRRWAASAGVCGSASERDVALFCEPLDSVLNYVYPTQGIRGGVNFTGLGLGDDDLTTRAGVTCGPAVSATQLDEIVGWLMRSGRGGFFSKETASFKCPLPSDQLQAGHATCVTPGSGVRDVHHTARCVTPLCASHRYVRSRFAMPKDQWDRVQGSHGLDLINILHGEGQNPHVRIYSDVLHCNPSLRAEQITGLIMRDALLLVSAIALITLYMVNYFGNIWLAILGIVQISISFPIMAFVVSVVLQQKPLSVRHQGHYPTAAPCGQI